MHWIEEAGIVAVIRLDDLSRAVELAEALVEGGVTALEFTYTNREAGSAIERVRACLLYTT
ncbi:MAG: 2-dehydro-3-deoxyphosphogluconate aldolase, partial [Thermomicrobiaceae bacterium]|nr:2-dehydro-3-deoxyphosphogluconate aldolase [Thermomicrobiaceae bacterium]